MGEFEDYMNARHLSACEAVYHICNFDTVFKRPAVRCLPVHLEGENIGSTLLPLVFLPCRTCHGTSLSP